MSDSKQKVVTLICERSCNLDSVTNESGQIKDMPDVSVVKFPCSGMIQPLMIEAALKAGATGVIVGGCQMGDCYYREGNRMIRARLVGDRPPGLKKTVDRRRVMALWLSRPQTQRFLSEAKTFVANLSQLEPPAQEKKGAAQPVKENK
jgi:coenzyme F420-reducing hydrogenase delta subunit